MMKIVYDIDSNSIRAIVEDESGTREYSNNLLVEAKVLELLAPTLLSNRTEKGSIRTITDPQLEAEAIRRLDDRVGASFDKYVRVFVTKDRDER